MGRLRVWDGKMVRPLFSKQIIVIRSCAFTERSKLHHWLSRAIYMILEWLSFRNEFIPSPCISLHLFTWYRDETLFLYKLYEFISVFLPNEILVLPVQNFILVSCKPKTNFVLDWKSQIVKSWVRVAHAHLIWHENHESKDVLTLSRPILSCECSTKFTRWRNSFQKENHSGIIKKRLKYKCNDLVKGLCCYFYWSAKGCQ